MADCNACGTGATGMSEMGNDLVTIEWSGGNYRSVFKLLYNLGKFGPARGHRNVWSYRRRIGCKRVRMRKGSECAGKLGVKTIDRASGGLEIKQAGSPCQAT
ncbi:hypothetical protein WA026_003994 [Henosepilachna vigintioctopunctata]|uniref:Uncharacterized protein n=1 Tax=Henosepilachna vigintioctopunctata TaxID=420089 RepID=A0AAW1U9A5_9CUCU